MRLCVVCARATQEALEDLSLERTEEQFGTAMAKAEWQKRTTTVGGGRELFWQNVPKLTAALETFLTERRGDGRREGATTFRWLDKVGPEQTARIVLRVVFDHFPTSRKLRRASAEVAERLRMALVARRDSTKELTHQPREALRVGAELIEQLETLGLVRLERLGRAKHVVPTERTLRALAERNDALRWRWPLFAPMVMPPLPWSEGNGGYRFALKGQLQLVHGAKGKPDRLPLVRRSLDTIQDTAWRIDRGMLGLVRETVLDGGGQLGLPRFPRPCSRARAPIDDEPDVSPPWEWREVRKQASEIRRVEQTIAIAEEVAGVDLWFPHYLDWRGRIYPVAGAPRTPTLCGREASWRARRNLARSARGRLLRRRTGQREYGCQGGVDRGASRRNPGDGAQPPR
jgi:hypothetical protein